MNVELRRTHPLVRWAYQFDIPPFQASLCQLFWRSVGFFVLWGVLASLVVGACYGIYRYPHDSLMNVLIFCGIVLTVALIAALFAGGSYINDCLRGDARGDSPTWQTIRSVKSKICPIVTIK